MSLSADQVLHVARLARLELAEDEVERFSGELSKVFDWVETINELGDLLDPVEDLRELAREALDLLVGQLEAGEAGHVQDLVAAQHVA